MIATRVLMAFSRIVSNQDANKDLKPFRKERLKFGKLSPKLGTTILDLMNLINGWLAKGFMRSTMLLMTFLTGAKRLLHTHYTGFVSFFRTQDNQDFLRKLIAFWTGWRTLSRKHVTGLKFLTTRVIVFAKVFSMSRHRKKSSSGYYLPEDTTFDATYRLECIYLQRCHEFTNWG